jgi:predicted membrane protein
MHDFESRREERRLSREERWRQRGMKGHGKGSVWTGIFILLIGVAALAKASYSGFPDWVFTWPMFLIALGFFIGLKHNFNGAGWFIIMVVGAVFLYDHFDPDVSMRRYVWPMALILVGFFLIIRPRRKSWAEKKNTVLQEDTPIAEEVTWSEEDFVDSTSIFGGAKKNILSKKFKGGDLVNIFGGTDLDLTQADFSGTAIIELTTIFGGTKLIVPSNWAVKSEAVVIFGSVEDKRKMQTISENPDKVLLLKGTVIFGGIDIKSY